MPAFQFTATGIPGDIAQGIQTTIRRAHRDGTVYGWIERKISDAVRKLADFAAYNEDVDFFFAFFLAVNKFDPHVQLPVINGIVGLCQSYRRADWAKQLRDIVPVLDCVAIRCAGAAYRAAVSDHAVSEHAISEDASMADSPMSS